MDVQLPPRDQARLAALAKQTGRAEQEIAQEMIGSCLDELEEVRGLLERRLDDIESGRIKPLTAEQLEANLERRKQEYLRQRS
jgi:putative addiction module component (TIGR02574 family)